MAVRGTEYERDSKPIFVERHGESHCVVVVRNFNLSFILKMHSMLRRQIDEITKLCSVPNTLSFPQSAPRLSASDCGIAAMGRIAPKCPTINQWHRIQCGKRSGSKQFCSLQSLLFLVSAFSRRTMCSHSKDEPVSVEAVQSALDRPLQSVAHRIAA